MTRFLLGLMALGLFGATPQASAACRWFGTQLQCDLGGSRVLIGTQQVDKPAYAGDLRPLPLLQSDELLGAGTVPDGLLLRLNLQNIGVYPGFCQKWGNETYCY
jgi:hypothetical protein